MEPLFNILGLFPSAEGISLFLFALLDNCKYHQTCPMCKASEKDIIHAQSACHVAKSHKKRFCFNISSMVHNSLII